MPESNAWSVFWAVWLTCVLSLPGNAQRHLPDLQIFESVEQMRLDIVVEHPAVDNGAATAGIPQAGETVAIQIFVPRAAGLTAFECVVELDGDALSGAFRVTSVKDWLDRDIRPLSSKGKPTFYIARLMPVVLPQSGHIATIVLAPMRILENPSPVPISCFITVVSTPPRRIWQMRCKQQLEWR